MTTGAPNSAEDKIAIVGMACQAPGAPDLETFWRNVVNGVDSIETLSDDELRTAGVPESLVKDPQYVRSGGFVANADRFDAGLFQCTPREAAMLDPQHRLLLECAWHALEHAGHGHLATSTRTGVYAGVANSNYYSTLVRPSLDPQDSSAAYQALLSGERDFATTRLSYYFNLTGPSLDVQTACSTSLVAVHLACQSLLSGECDIALAGGAAVRMPQRIGYLYEEGMILSPDGRCRPFDARSNGTTIGNGAGLVVLRRLEDALTDGDTVHAVILGSAVNNDGSSKIGYTAPSIEGQSGVVLEAQLVAGVTAESIGYVEAHGTGTRLGDPIEVTALTDAFRRSTTARGFCALGSVKSNIGHLDIAAGVIGLIKAALVVSRGTIPPMLHFRDPNPALSLDSTPFYVPGVARTWPTHPVRRAGVSSFGIGGTNAHVILEAHEDTRPPVSHKPFDVLVVSAASAAACRSTAHALAAGLELEDAPALPNVAYTLAVGRRWLAYRQAVACTSRADAIEQLRAAFEPDVAVDNLEVVWVFLDDAGSYAGMGQDLAKVEPAYRTAQTDASLAFSAFPHARPEDMALFTLQYGLTALWREWGVEPVTILGLGTGEYAAGVAAGVLTLDDAVRLISARGDAERFQAELSCTRPSQSKVNWLSAQNGQYTQGLAARGIEEWLSHLEGRSHARVALRALLDGSAKAVVQIGPGDAITEFSRGYAPPSTVIVGSCPGKAKNENSSMADSVAALWKAGVDIDWEGFHRQRGGRRVPLPLYPFDRARHWFDTPTSDTSASPRPVIAPGVKIYAPTWMRMQGLPKDNGMNGQDQHWLLVGDLHGLASKLDERLRRRGSSVVRSRLDSGDLEAVLSINRAHRVVYLDANYDGIVRLGQLLISTGIASKHTSSLIAVTESLHLVSGVEASDPRRSLALGPLLVLPQEHPEIHCRNIDIAGNRREDLAARLCDECVVDDAPGILAIRDTHRWRMSAEPVDPIPSVSIVASEDEAPVYLITGGMGKIGLALARHLQKTEGAKVALIGRQRLSALLDPVQDEDEMVTFDIDDIDMETQAETSSGPRDLCAADTLLIEADVSDEYALRRAFAAAETAFGRVDVIVHAAGAAARETFTPFEDLSPAVAARHFSPKVNAVDVLCAIAREKPLRACVLMSSLASCLGGLGFAAYAAANAYMDAVAQREDGVNGVRWVSIGWDAWQPPDNAFPKGRNGTALTGAISEDDGAAAFSRILASNAGPNVLVSATELLNRLNQSAPAEAASRRDKVSRVLSDPVPPSADELIASIWCELLGLDKVDPDDDFYDLGGNSLLATQVAARLRRAFGIELSVQVVFEETTVESLARRIEALGASESEQPGETN